MSLPKRPIEILLVEDSPTDRLIAVEALSSARVLNNLHTVQDGVEAMEFLHRVGKYQGVARPDLIILDLNLPRMDGRAVLRELKSDPRFRMIPIVVMTTSQDEKDVAASYGLHANCFISKPVAFDAFIQVIRSLENFWFEVVTFPPALLPSSTPAAVPGGVAAAPIRLLLVEDSPSEALLCRLALEECSNPSFELTVVAALAAAEASLAGFPFDAVIADLGLPDSQGLATVMRLREAAPVLPLIVLTGLDDDELGLKALEKGAQDYLCKGALSSRVLVRAVRYAVQRSALERQLSDSQRMEAMGRLAAGVAHDFNNLLTTIGGHAALLAGEAGLNDDARSSIAEIRSAVSRATSFTRQLLAFTHQQVARRQPLDLVELIGGCQRTLARLLGEGITLELQLDSGLPQVNGDRILLEQALINLAMHAREAMPAGGKMGLRCSLEVPAAPASHGEARLCISVSDTGAGIPAALLPRVFEPFLSLQPGGKGGGLGLAAVHGIARQHEGRVEVHSTPGQGTRFDLLLPCLSPVGTAASAPAAPAPVRRIGRECILVVDDERSVSVMVRSYLQQQGYRVLVAADASEALELWKTEGDQVDLVVSDFILSSGVNGVDLLNQLSSGRPGLPGIIVSGYGIDESEEGDLLVPGENYLQKPYSMEELAALVRQRLDTPSTHLTPHRNSP